MKIIKNLLIFFIFSLVLNSCNTLSEAGKVLRNEKIRTTDEFLVKKREPLSLPPDYKKLPEPGQDNSAKQESKDRINKRKKPKQ